MPEEEQKPIEEEKEEKPAIDIEGIKEGLPEAPPRGVVLEDIEGVMKHYTAAPTKVPRNFKEQIFLYVSGTTYRLYLYIKDAWQKIYDSAGYYLSTVRKTTQFSMSATSFTDVTDLVITVTTKASRVLLIFNSDAYHSANAGIIYLTFSIDGTDAGSTSGLGMMQFGASQSTEDLYQYASLHYVTDVLTAGSHTFKVRMKVSGAIGYLNWANSSAIFSAIELA